MTTLDRICGQVLKDTEDGAIYIGFDRKTYELYAGYVAGNSGISKNWTLPYDADQPIDEQVTALNELVETTLHNESGKDS